MSIILSSDLSFNININTICNKALCTFGFIRSNCSECKNLNCLKVLKYVVVRCDDVRQRTAYEFNVFKYE